MGIAITYLRRYSLSPMLGLVAEEDTDGNVPDRIQISDNRRLPPPIKKPAPIPTIGADAAKRLSGKLLEFGVDISGQIGYANAVLIADRGSEIVSLEELTATEAKTLFEEAQGDYNLRTAQSLLSDE
jgi:hypothetical protein